MKKTEIYKFIYIENIEFVCLYNNALKMIKRNQNVWFPCHVGFLFLQLEQVELISSEKKPEEPAISPKLQ